MSNTTVAAAAAAALALPFLPTGCVTRALCEGARLRRTEELRVAEIEGAAIERASEGRPISNAMLRVRDDAGGRHTILVELPPGRGITEIDLRDPPPGWPSVPASLTDDDLDAFRCAGVSLPAQSWRFGRAIAADGEERRAIQPDRGF